MNNADNLHQSYRRGIPVVTPVQLQVQSEENQAASGSNFSDEKIRRAFITKIYTVLLVQLAVTFGFIYFCTFHFDVKKFMWDNWKIASWSFLAVGILLAVVATAFYCFENARRQFPLNYILLALVTVSMSILLGVFTGLLPPKTVVLAVGGTAVVCLVLTVFAFQSKIDFTTQSGTIAAFTSTVLFFGIIAIVSKNEILDLFVSIIMVFMAGWYFVYDTQLIVGGNHKFAFYPEDYIFATLCLYFDILGVLTMLLKILSVKERRRNNAQT